MRGSVQLTDLTISSLSNLTSEEMVDGGNSPRLIHPTQIPGKFMEFWGYYEGDQDATIRVRIGASKTDKTGEAVFEVAVTADQGFFYAATERLIDEHTFLNTTSQLDVGSSNCKLRFTIIQISCEERPESPEVNGSLLTMSNSTDQISVPANPGEEAILKTGFGPYFHALIDWDSLPGTQVRFHFHASITGAGPNNIWRVRVGDPVTNLPDEIVGTTVLTWTGTGQPNLGDYITKPTGRKMLSVTVEDPDGAFLVFINPVLYIESDVVGTRAVLLHGPYPPILPATSQINNWVINFDWFQSANILVSMSALTKTNAAAVTADMHAKIGGTFDSQASGTDLLSYSILAQSPLNQFVPTGSSAIVANPGGTQLVKWSVTGHAQTQAQYKSILLVGQ